MEPWHHHENIEWTLNPWAHQSMKMMGALRGISENSSRASSKCLLRCRRPSLFWAPTQQTHASAGSQVVSADRLAGWR